MTDVDELVLDDLLESVSCREQQHKTYNCKGICIPPSLVITVFIIRGCYIYNSSKALSFTKEICV